MKYNNQRTVIDLGFIILFFLAIYICFNDPDIMNPSASIIVIIFILICFRFALIHRIYTSSARKKYIEEARENALRAQDIASYNKNYDLMLEEMNKLKKNKMFLSRKMVTEIESDIADAEKDREWHLRDAIVRMTNNTVTLIKKEYANSEENKLKTYQAFKDELVKWSGYYTEDETKRLVSKCDKKVAALLYKAHPESMTKYMIESDATAVKSLPLSQDPVDIIMDKVDKMSGEEFEHFWADYLIKAGYENVNVTVTSGDFGGDVTAEKDSVKYVFQCKRFTTTSVGVKAVQEVLGSISLYGSHVGVVVTNQYFTRQALTLAAKNNILCWDRTELIKKLSVLQGDS